MALNGRNIAIVAGIAVIALMVSFRVPTVRKYVIGA